MTEHGSAYMPRVMAVGARQNHKHNLYLQRGGGGRGRGKERETDLWERDREAGRGSDIMFVIYTAQGNRDIECVHFQKEAELALS